MLGRRFRLVGLALVVVIGAVFFVRWIPDGGLPEVEHPSASRSSETGKSNDALVVDTEDPVRVAAREQELPNSTRSFADRTTTPSGFVIETRFFEARGGPIRRLELLRLTDADGVKLELDANGGEWKFKDGLHAGKWSLDARAKGRRPLHWEFELIEGVPVRVLTLSMLAPTEVAIRVLTPTGESLVDALSERHIAYPRAGASRDLASPPSQGDIELAPQPRPLVNARRSRSPVYVHAVESSNLICDGVLGLGNQLRFEADESRNGSERPPAVIVWQPGEYVRDPLSSSLPFDEDVFLPSVDSWPLFVSLFEGLDLISTQPVQAATELVTFTVPLERVLQALYLIRIMLVDAQSGNVVRDARVELGEAQAMSAADGQVVLEGQAGGTRHLRIAAKDFALVDGMLELPAHGPCDLGRWPLEPMARIHGHIEGDKLSIGGIAIRFLREDSPPVLDLAAPFQSITRERQLECIPHPDKTFEFYGLPRGQYVLRAITHNASACSESVFVDLHPDETREVSLSLLPATRVVLLGRETLPSATRVTVRDIRGVRVDEKMVRYGDWDEQLLPGEYTIGLTFENASPREIPLHVGTDEKYIDIGK